MCKQVHLPALQTAVGSRCRWLTHIAYALQERTPSSSRCAQESSLSSDTSQTRVLALNLLADTGGRGGAYSHTNSLSFVITFTALNGDEAHDPRPGQALLFLAPPLPFLLLSPCPMPSQRGHAASTPPSDLLQHLYRHLCRQRFEQVHGLLCFALRTRAHTHCPQELPLAARS